MKFQQEQTSVLWIGEQPFTEMLFSQFSNIIKIVGKVPDQHLNVWLFSNPGYKVQILVENTGQICPVSIYLKSDCKLHMQGKTFGCSKYWYPCLDNCKKKLNAVLIKFNCVSVSPYCKQ